MPYEPILREAPLPEYTGVAERGRVWRRDGQGHGFEGEHDVRSAFFRMSAGCTILRAAPIFLMMMLGGCIAPGTGTKPDSMPDSLPAVSGIATYLERMLLPPDSVVEVTLEDVSRADARAQVLGRVVLEAQRSPPFRFCISYDPSKIDPRHTYVVRATVRAEGRLLFTSDEVHPVLTQGAGEDVEIVMRRVQDAAVPAPQPEAASTVFGGELRYMADAATFTECLSGRRYPVAMEADWIKLERAYLAAVTTPGGPLYVTFEGQVAGRPRMEGDGTEPTVVVKRYINVWPGQNCERARGTAELTNTIWRIVRLGDDVLPRTLGREPRLMLRQNESRYSATVGCNQLIGAYTVEGTSLSFSRGAATKMACPPPLDRIEQMLVAALGETRTFRIYGETLELYDARGASLALFESLYLR